MLFDRVKTEEDVGRLKLKIMKDAALRQEIEAIRKGFGYFLRSPAKNTMPTNAELLALYKKLIKAGKETSNRATELILRKNKTKSNSGVAVVSVLTKPYPCPGNCLYCPTEQEMPKSYLSKEPAAARALRNGFDAARQAVTRLRALQANGHPTDKVEMIIIGGTWGAYQQKYRENFVRDLFFACNTFGVRKRKRRPLAKEQALNERAKCRIVGLSIETRPDWVNEKEITHMRRLGVTKVELGVQHLDDEILNLNRRGTTQKQIIFATRLLKDAGFKIVYHMMPNLLGSDSKKDLAAFHKLFTDENYQPDMLKIYPCIVLESTDLHDIWKSGKYRPYSATELKNLLIDIKKIIPPYVRIMRVIRDIPAEYIVAGSKITNLRQDLLSGDKRICRCIRCREIREEEARISDLALHKIEYAASEGREIFLSWERKSDNRLASFLRLRLPTGHAYRIGRQAGLPYSLLSNKSKVAPWMRNGGALYGAALIRELHTYGRLMRIGVKGAQSQHRGLGQKLLHEAEKIAKKAGYKKMAVISGVGVRNYYRKLGYRLQDTYMVKSI
ncbi:MAG: tRNA uridine(34) 5-carboxymethylaminomethyl modification radical SAM/GNAT enzyme Elp3 [Candidatus Niyogibacteria bacterium]|nr:tRNA uridine(34) 5-carboxymethylaminomethyl modification radical SAM/GNAT enzyme Elp3 [Candidatus Niyogibacteria bacterium]